VRQFPLETYVPMGHLRRPVRLTRHPVRVVDGGRKTRAPLRRASRTLEPEPPPCAPPGPSRLIDRHAPRDSRRPTNPEPPSRPPHDDSPGSKGQSSFAPAPSDTPAAGSTFSPTGSSSARRPTPTVRRRTARSST
jgi:hypothetical protein